MDGLQSCGRNSKKSGCGGALCTRGEAEWAASEGRVEMVSANSRPIPFLVYPATGILTVKVSTPEVSDVNPKRSLCPSPLPYIKSSVCEQNRAEWHTTDFESSTPGKSRLEEFMTDPKRSPQPTTRTRSSQTACRRLASSVAAPTSPASGFP